MTDGNETSPHSSAKLQVHDFLITRLTDAIEKLDKNVEGMRSEIAASNQRSFELRLHVERHTEQIEALQEASDELASRRSVHDLASSRHAARAPRLSPTLKHAITALITALATLIATYGATAAGAHAASTAKSQEHQP